MTFESVETSLVIRAERGQADLRVSVGHAGDKGRSAISLAGTISTAQRQTLAIDDSSGSQVTLQFDGTLEAANLNLREAAEFFGPRPVPEQLQGVVNVHSHVRAVPGVAGYDVVLSDLSANLEQLKLTGQASLSGLLTPQPTFAVTVATLPDPIEPGAHDRAGPVGPSAAAGDDQRPRDRRDGGGCLGDHHGSSRRQQDRSCL